MDVQPIPHARLRELVQLTEPVRQRVIFNNVGDWNLRRLLALQPGVRLGFDPAGYLDVEDSELPLGAYGYHDAHPLAREACTSVDEYLFDRMGAILRLVPKAEELHLRLSAFERMLDDGYPIVEAVHEHGMRLDVWTLDAGTPDWLSRLERAVEAGVDMVTTNTPAELAQALG
jgi:glycerophosphoryl diester phosphodiesterase